MEVKDKKVKEPAVIEIIDAWCKGCEICTNLCPTNAIEMKGRVVVVKDIDACTKCMLCELRCPDFAITVS